MSFEFSEAYLLYSNLGGQGPDTWAPASIRFVNVATVTHAVMGSVRVDLVVTSQSAAYTPFNSSLNTLNGQFAQINLACNHAVDLRVEMVLSCARARSCVGCSDASLTEQQRIGCFASGCS